MKIDHSNIIYDLLSELLTQEKIINFCKVEAYLELKENENVNATVK